MKIKFTKLPTTDGIIKISLDGGDSFKDYNIADIHKSGIPLDDNQDYEKNQIQASANVLKNLNIGFKCKSWRWRRRSREYKRTIFYNGYRYLWIKISKLRNWNCPSKRYDFY